MLVLPNVIMELSNVRKKKLPNVTKEFSFVILKLHTMRMKPANVRKKGTTKCDESTIKCDVGSA